VPSPPGLACLARTSGAGAEQRSHLLSRLHDSFLPPTSPVSSLTRRPPTRSIWLQNCVVSSPVRRRHCSAVLEYHRGHKVPLLQQSRSLHSLAGPPSLLDDLTPNPNEPRLRETPPKGPLLHPVPYSPVPKLYRPTSPRLAAPDQVQPYTHGKPTAYLGTRTRSWQYESQLVLSTTTTVSLKHYSDCDSHHYTRSLVVIGPRPSTLHRCRQCTASPL
jgi:hypothetical protein